MSSSPSADPSRVTDSRTDAARGSATRGAGPATTETCDICGSAQLAWQKCKLICGNCRSIVKSCADL